MKKISKDNKLPLYYQLKQIIQEMIENEDYKPNEIIPAEREIGEFQGVSRMTVNKAINSLVNEGILYRIQGKGTFVSKPKVGKHISQIKGFSQIMEEANLVSHKKIISFQTKTASKAISDCFNLPKSQNLILEIIILRYCNYEPFVLETVLLPLYKFSKMSIDSIKENSLYKIFSETYNYNIVNIKESIEPIILSEYETSMLCEESRSLALAVTRESFLEDNTIIEITKSIYRSDKYKYEIYLSNKK